MNSEKGKGLALFLFPFLLLCTLNSATYRYGASDQAFYIPAVLLRLNPQLFPRDAPLIVSQARLTVTDEAIATLARLTAASLPVLFAALYVVSLALLAAGAWLVADRLYRTRWTAVGLLAAMTLRHAIWRTGTNTLEGYFHPRQLAFALGVLAIAALLRNRLVLAVCCVVLAGAVHPTTALWFAIWVSIAAAVIDRRWRTPLAATAILAAAAATWALTAGPLAGRFVRMDPAWLATLVTKDYLFPFDWPLSVWAVNLLYIPLVVSIYRRRSAGGLVDRAETGVVIGCLSLMLVFAAALPFNAARIAMAVQLQTPRVFWMLDFMATVYVVWALAEGVPINVRRAQLTAAIIALASLTRGAYVKVLRFPERAVALIGIKEDDWGRAMAWARSTSSDSGWLVDPMHAVRYGTSLRVAGERDVLVEAVKDQAIGMYDRDVAMRTRDRIAAVGDFASLTSDRARSLGVTYGLSYLVTDRSLDLPLAFESGQLRIYRLR